MKVGLIIAAFGLLALLLFRLPAVLATPEGTPPTAPAERLESEASPVSEPPFIDAAARMAARTALSDPVQRSAEAAWKDFGGRVITEQGVGLAEGRVVAVAPHSLSASRALRREGALDGQGSFSLQLPAAEWDGHVTFAAVYDSSGMMLESGFVRIGGDVLIPVKSRADESWYVRGSLDLRGAPSEIAGWLAVYSAGALQPLAESQFSGARSDVRLRFNLAGDADYAGEVSAHVLAPGLRRCAVLPFASLQAFRAAFSAGVVVEVSSVSLSVPPFPRGGRPTRIQVAPIDERFMNNAWQQVERDGATVVLGEGEYKVTGADDGGRSAFGVVEPLDDHLAVARWYVEAPGPHTQVVVTVDEDGRPISGASLGAGLLMSDRSLHGLFSVFAITDANGEAKLEGLPAGDYSINVKCPNAVGFPAVSGTMTVPSPRHTITLSRPTQVWVEPDWHDGPDVLGDFATYWRRSSDPAARWDRRQISARLGHAVVQGLRPGDYDLYVYMDPYLGFAKVSVDATAEPQTVSVSCAIPTGISGRVVGADGAPVVGRWISMSRERADGRPSGLEWNRARTDETGAFWLSPDGAPGAKIVVWDAACSSPAIEVDATAASTIRLVD